MLAQQLKHLLSTVDDATDIEIVAGFDLLTFDAVYTQGQLLDYAVRPHQLDQRLTPEQRREFIKRNGRFVEWIETPTLWRDTLFFIAIPHDTSVKEQP